MIVRVQTRVIVETIIDYHQLSWPFERAFSLNPTEQMVQVMATFSINLLPNVASSKHPTVWLAWLSAGGWFWAVDGRVRKRFGAFGALSDLSRERPRVLGVHVRNNFIHPHQ